MVEALEKINQIRIVGTVANGWDVIRTSARVKPDIVLLDFSLPGLSGLEVTGLIRREFPKILVIILLDEENEEYIKAVEQSGAWAHLTKSQLAQELPSLLDKLG
jgi:DNA-binding NarL/FixJ family response regulator